MKKEQNYHQNKVENDKNESEKHYFDLGFLSWLTDFSNSCSPLRNNPYLGHIHPFAVWTIIRIFFSLYCTKNNIHAD